MTLAIGTYIRLIEADGSDPNLRFQNFFQGESRIFNDQTHIFAAFGFSGGTIDLQAANITASLAFGLNALSLSTFQRAVNDRWLVEVSTVWLDPETLDETDTHSTELYAITGLSHDNQRLAVGLSSPLDAIAQNAPRRVLSTRMVGNLPSTGQINLN